MIKAYLGALDLSPQIISPSEPRYLVMQPSKEFELELFLALVFEPNTYFFAHDIEFKSEPINSFKVYQAKYQYARPYGYIEISDTNGAGRAVLRKEGRWLQAVKRELLPATYSKMDIWRNASWRQG